MSLSAAAIAAIQRYADESRIRTCAEQGVPPVTTDPVVAAQVAELAGDWWRERAQAPRERTDAA